MENHTINICLIPRGEIYTICKKLNSLDRGNYNRNSREFIPHVTLGMKTLSSEQIQKLGTELKNLKFSKQTSVVKDYYTKEVAPGDMWTGIYIEKPSSLYDFQKAVLEISKKYIPQQRDKRTYAVDDFFEQKEIAFYEEEQYLERPELHITLSKQENIKEYENMQIPSEIAFETLVIGKIGNYGSVREILFEIPLK